MSQEFKIGQRVKVRTEAIDWRGDKDLPFGIWEGTVTGFGLEGYYYTVTLDNPIETEDDQNGTTTIALAPYDLEKVSPFEGITKQTQVLEDPLGSARFSIEDLEQAIKHMDDNYGDPWVEWISHEEYEERLAKLKKVK